VSTPNTKSQARLAEQARRATFETLYRDNYTAVSAYFARRSTDPQVVADLTSETFVQAIRSVDTYEGRGHVRAWLFGIARLVYAQHHAEIASGRAALTRFAGQIELAHDDIDDLVDRIDAQQAGRELLRQAANLPELERSALELVDVAGMTPRNAARALGISQGAMRVRLFRARARLRKKGT
jgi:RNA polymerase sigma factor (sigma-70 family)